MPPELVAWFDRRLEALTDVPAATKAGSRAPAKEMARLATPEEMKPNEYLAALCLKRNPKLKKEGPGAPKLKRKEIADRILAGQVFELEAVRKAELVSQGKGDEWVPMAPFFESVAYNNRTSLKDKFSEKTVARAVKGNPELAPKKVIKKLLPKVEADLLVKKLEAQGYRLEKKSDQPLQPHAYRVVPARGHTLIKYLPP